MTSVLTYEDDAALPSSGGQRYEIHDGARRARSSFISPSAPMPMTAALRPMSGGAALVAFAMTAASELVPPALAMPSWPDWGGS